MNLVNIIYEPPRFQPVLTNGLFYTVSADTSNTYKFRYTYNLYVDGQLAFEGKATPNPYGLGVMDMSRILKTYCQNNPIAVWDTTDIYTHQTFPFSRPYKNEVINYQVYFGFEYASTALGDVTGFTGVYLTGLTEGNPAVPSSLNKTFQSTMGVNGRATQQNFNMSPFVLSGTPTGTNPTTNGLFLTNSPRYRNIQETEYYTLAFTNWYLDESTVSEPYYVKYEFFDDQGTSLTAVTFDNITTNGGGPRPDCTSVYQSYNGLYSTGATDYNTLYVGAGPKNLEDIMPINATQYTVQLFGKFTGSTSPIQPTPTPTPTPSSTPTTCNCVQYQVDNTSLIAVGVINYADCDNVFRTLAVDPQESALICVCNSGDYQVVSGALTVTVNGSCATPTPTPTATSGSVTPTPTPTPSATYRAWTVLKCSSYCIGGQVGCASSSGSTLYTQPGLIITNPLTTVYTNSSLTTPYVGFFQYSGCLYYSDGSSVSLEGCLGDPC